jgi:hypothetical protein
MKTLKELLFRLKLPSPAVFIRIQNLCLGIGGSVTTLGLYLKQNLDNPTLSTSIISIGGTITLLGYFLAKLPIKQIEELEKLIENKPSEEASV